MGAGVLAEAAVASVAVTATAAAAAALVVDVADPGAAVAEEVAADLPVEVIKKPSCHISILVFDFMGPHLVILLGGPGREGDWRCAESSCGNMNFSWRSECNRCKTPRSDLTGGPGPGGPPSGGFGGEGETQPSLLCSTLACVSLVLYLSL